MVGKLNFNQRQKSQNALNEFEHSYGRKFNALIMVRMNGSDRSTPYRDQDVYIQRGQYIDHNSPYVIVLDESYDCEYTVIENNGYCLTIKLADRTIDILPQDSEKYVKENTHE